MNKIFIESNAKINLHLDVISKGNDGYHGVRTVMQSISLCDRISVGLNDSTEIHVSGNTLEMPLGEKNIAYRAARLFFESLGYKRGVDIEIEKHIPMAAGLAGGSADAAGTLLALNRLCGAPYSRDALARLSAPLGADVPFCVVGGTKYAHGKGEILEDFPSMPDCTLVVACGGEGVSTPWAYSRLDQSYNNFDGDGYIPRDIEGLKRANAEKNIEAVAHSIYNIFEGVILPEREVARHIKTTLLENGALGAMMSGSGPSVFGIFEDASGAHRAEETLKRENIPAFVCRPVF